MLCLTRWRLASRPRSLRRALCVAAVLLLALTFSPAVAQVQLCVDCTLYARTELNLRQQPDITAPVLRFVPAGAAVHRTSGKEVDTYAPVTYDGVEGWVVALGLVASLEEIDPIVPLAAAPPVSADERVTLEPLVLRAGPAADAEPILVMPQGTTVTLTREGAENGYVTVDYGGELGWAYADLLARPDELTQ